jgi:hypothetical protein
LSATYCTHPQVATGVTEVTANGATPEVNAAEAREYRSLTLPRKTDPPLKLVL